jgi:acetate kinase
MPAKDCNVDQRISSGGATVAAWVIPTDENLMVGRQTRQLLDGSGARR